MESVKLKAKEKFENENISFRKLAKLFGKSHTYWGNVARTEKWVKYEKPMEAVEELDMIVRYGGAEDVEVDKLLSPTAIRKIRELVSELGDLYSSVDEQMIMTYAFAYQRSLKLEQLVQEEGETIVSISTGGKYLNPTYSALLACNSQLIKIGNDFGFSVASRTRNSLDFGQKSTEPTIFDMIKDVLNE